MTKAELVERIAKEAEITKKAAAAALNAVVGAVQESLKKKDGSIRITDVGTFKVVQRKVPGDLKTPSGKIEGEKSLWADKAEALTIENTGEVYPGLYVAGMSANATYGGPRMGPIFGGMLLSGEKAAKEVLQKL